MSRRVSLPGAQELFHSQGRPTDEPAPDPVAESARSSQPAEALAEEQAEDPSSDEKRAPSRRVRHDEKITVYVTSDELMDLERTRLVLRGDHRLAVDRGRIVREAIHLALEGVKDDGAASALVRRLREQ